MKRDMDKVRSLLLALEAERSPYTLFLKSPLIGGMESPEEQVNYLQMLASGGFLEKSGNSHYRITWAGHEFIDKVRDDAIWGKTREGAMKVGSWSVKLLGELANGYIKARAKDLGLPIID